MPRNINLTSVGEANITPIMNVVAKKNATCRFEIKFVFVVGSKQRITSTPKRF